MDEPLPPLRRPWHGASDREEDARVRALRLQRAEVDVLLAFRAAAKDSVDAAQLWRRLALIRGQRRALLPAEEGALLPDLPAAPRGALTRWQALRHCIGRLVSGALALRARASRGGERSLL
ncbi:MAG TPA: hypothetical protein VD970_16990 [Acetobacteraceae bacterium]|nr:hypothetical protein [Acetobacteraceae bacterium]